MVNGFGFYDYFPDADSFIGPVNGGEVDPNNYLTSNYYGFRQDVPESFPGLLKQHLKDMGYDVNDDYMLAISGMRTAELRTIFYGASEFIDPYEHGDKVIAAFENLPEEYDKTEEGFRQYYADMIRDANLITYNFHYDFGYTLSSAVMGFTKGHSPSEYNFGAYLDDMQIEEMYKVKAYVKSLVTQLLVDYNMDLELYGPLINLADVLSDAIAFVLIGYCVNFDKNMEFIFETNEKDVTVVVVDSYNTFAGMDVIKGDLRIPLGGIYQIVLDAANTYTKHLSPYASKTYHTDVDGTPLLFAGEFEYFDDRGSISDDGMSASIYATGIWSGYYSGAIDGARKGLSSFGLGGLSDEEIVNLRYCDDEDCPIGGPHFCLPALGCTCKVKGSYFFSEHCPTYTELAKFYGEGYGGMAFGDALTTFLECVFKSSEMDFGYLTDNFNGKAAAIATKAIDAIAAIMSGETVEETVEGCKVGSIEFNKDELVMLWFQFFLSGAEALMSHPCEDGHEYIFNCIINNTSKGGVGELYDSASVVLEDAVDDLRVYINMLKNSPEGQELQARFDAFYLECNDVIVAIEAGDVEAAMSEMDDVYTSFNALSAYVDTLINNTLASDEFAALSTLVKEKLVEIKGYIDAIEPYVEFVIDNVDWDAVGAEIDAIAKELLEEFKGTEYYAELEALVECIEADLKAKYDALIDAKDACIDYLMGAVADFKAEVESAIAEFKQYLLDLGTEVDAKIKAAIEEAIAAYEAILLKIDALVEKIQMQLSIACAYVTEIIEKITFIAEEVETKILEIYGNVSAYVDNIVSELNAFVAECQDVLDAIMSGNKALIDAAFAKMYASFLVIQERFGDLVQMFSDSPVIMAICDAVDALFLEIQGIVDSLNAFINGAIESLSWEDISAMFDAIASELLEKVKGTELYAEVEAMVLSIRAAIEQKCIEIVDMVKMGIIGIDAAIDAFEATIKGAIEQVNAYILSVGAYIDAEILAALNAFEAMLAEIDARVAYVIGQLLVLNEKIEVAVENIKAIAIQIEAYFDDIVDYVQVIVGEVEDVIDAIEMTVVKIESYVASIQALIQQGMDAYEILENMDVLAILENIEKSLNNINREISDLFQYLSSDLVQIIELRIECMESFINLIVCLILDLDSYDEIDDKYYETEDVTVIGGSFVNEYGLTAELRLMDILEVIGGKTSDGRYKLDSVDKDAIVADIKENNVLVFESDSGNVTTVVYDFLKLILQKNGVNILGAPADIDFTRYSELIGVDASEWFNEMEIYLQPVIDKLKAEYPGNEEIIDLVSFLAERIAYNYFGVFDSMVETVGIAQAINPNVTVMFTGAYNPFYGVSVDLGGTLVPVGDVYDAVIPLFNKFVSEFCEDAEGVVFVDISETETVLSSIGVLSLSDPEVISDLLIKGGLFGLFVPSDDGYAYIDGQIESVLDNMDEIYLSYLINFDANTGVGDEVEQQKAYYGAEIILNANTFTKTGYTFVGWNTKADGSGQAYADKASVMNITDGREITLYAQWEVNKYTITFMNDDGNTVLQTLTVEYGEMPEYTGETPTKDSTLVYSYEFAGWAPKIEFVTGDATYVATYTKTDVMYTITWVVADNEFKESYKFGELPSYEGSTEKAADAQYTYTFIGWDETPVTVTADATYTALYSVGVNKYTVTWVDGDGKTLKTEKVAYGTVPAYVGDDPTKTATAQYTYTFKGWSPEVVAVTGEATYTAQFDSTVNQYTVTWIVDGEETEDVVAYGEMPIYNNGMTPVKDADEDHVYEFVGWNPKVVEVTGDATYEAIFHEVIVFIPAVDDNEAVFTPSDVPETVHTVIVQTDVWEIAVPDTLFKDVASDAEVKLSLNVLTKADVPVDVRKVAGDKFIVSLNMLVGGQELSDFGNETVTVSFHFELPDGMDASKIVVWYFDEVTQELEEHPATYDANTSTIMFETTHFSYWLVGEKVTDDVTEDPTNEVLITFIMVMIVLAFIALCAVMTRDKW